MTWSAQFKVQDVGDGPAPIDILAIASIEDGTLSTNTEQAKSMELRIQIDADTTSITEGFIINAWGHFDNGSSGE